MRTRAPIFSALILTSLVLALPARAEDAPPPADMPGGHSPGGPADAPSAAPAPREAPPRAAAPNPGEAQAQKGEPGMLGQPWPKSAEEASKTLGMLFAHLATTEDYWQAGQIAVSIEKLWRLPGGDTVNLLIDRAEQASAKNQLDLALKLLDAAVDLAPDYAEAWNRRAYVQYRMGNSEPALGDLRRTLALEPNHFRALEGMAKILSDLGEKKGALKAYEKLLTVHPNMEGAKTAAEELRKAVEGQGI